MPALVPTLRVGMHTLNGIMSTACSNHLFWALNLFSMGSHAERGNQKMAEFMPCGYVGTRVSVRGGAALTLSTQHSALSTKSWDLSRQSRSCNVVMVRSCAAEGHGV